MDEFEEYCTYLYKLITLDFRYLNTVGLSNYFCVDSDMTMLEVVIECSRKYRNNKLKVTEPYRRTIRVGNGNVSMTCIYYPL